jgi:MFS family permease
VIGFGGVSLAIDLVADGAKSIAGPLLGELGATALVVGLVTGSAEALGFVLRLVSGPLVDRTRRYWDFAIAGYLLTAISVPLLAVTPFLGAAGLTIAAGLIVIERVGKAVRSPAKTVLLAFPASAVGRGRGFGVHKLLDQIGAFSGPLLVAAVIAATGMLWPAFAVLLIPALLAMALLLWMRRRVPDPSSFEREAGVSTLDAVRQPARGIPVTIVLFSISTALTALGLVGFGVLSFHLTAVDLVPLAAVPLVFALGMFAAAIAALVTGRLYDRVGGAVLFVVPLLAAGVPLLVLGDAIGAALVGIVLWGAAMGIQDSTVKALVADLVAPARRGTAYGVFAVFQGVGTFAGAVLAGAFYPDAVAISAITVPAQAIALVLLVIVVRRQRRDRVALVAA